MSWNLHFQRGVFSTNWITLQNRTLRKMTKNRTIPRISKSIQKKNLSYLTSTHTDFCANKFIWLSKNHWKLKISISFGMKNDNEIYENMWIMHVFVEFWCSIIFFDGTLYEFVTRRPNKYFFQSCLLIYFVLDCHAVQHDASGCWKFKDCDQTKQETCVV